MKRLSGIFLMFIALLLLSQSSSFAGPGNKLKRGLANTTTGWIETFTTAKNFSDEHGRAAGFFLGVPMGIVKGIWRTAVGVYETVTFPLPLPNNYEPIVEPEFVLD